MVLQPYFGIQIVVVGSSLIQNVRTLEMHLLGETALAGPMVVEPTVEWGGCWILGSRQSRLLVLVAV